MSFNAQAFFDGILCLVAVWAMLQTPTQKPALRLSFLLLASAALLGTLRFSGVFPLPQAHKVLSLFGATVALPLLAIACCWSQSLVSTQLRYTSIFAVVSMSMTLLIVGVAGLQVVASAVAVIAVASILINGLMRKQYMLALGGLFLMAALLGFAAKIQLVGLQPGDWLHIGMAVGLICVHRFSQSES